MHLSIDSDETVRIILKSQLWSHSLFPRKVIGSDLRIDKIARLPSSVLEQFLLLVPVLTDPQINLDTLVKLLALSEAINRDWPVEERISCILTNAALYTAAGVLGGISRLGTEYDMDHNGAAMNLIVCTELAGDQLDHEKIYNALFNLVLFDGSLTNSRCQALTAVEEFMESLM